MAAVGSSSNLIFKAGAALMTIGISGGAFGAHTLSKQLADIKGGSSNWSLASHYLTINGAAILAISQHPVYSKRRGAPAIIMGTLLFSGSIYALLLSQNKFVRSIAGPATPVGGVLMIAGFTSLLF